MMVAPPSFVSYSTTTSVIRACASSDASRVGP